MTLPDARSSRSFDIVVWGATGFTGTLVAKYIARAYYGEQKQAVKFALAGRNQSKLEKVKDAIVQINPKCKDVPILVGDLSDDKSMEAVVEQGKVVISTAGPYALHGEPVVRACARTGTDYVDITGEAHWVKKMMDKYSDDIKARNCLIISFCGFDSIPSDLGTLYAVTQLKEKTGDAASSAHGYFTLKGGVSGGTIASIFNILSQPSSEIAKATDKYSLQNEEDKPKAVRPLEKEIVLPSYSKDIGKWTAPFLMSGVNTRVVRRSAAALKYGPDFAYNESMAGSFFASILTWFGLAFFGLMAFFRPTRWLLGLLLPKPGEGPSEETMRTGFFKTLVVAKSSTGKKVTVELKGGEPGYKCTSEMLTQAALTLVFDREKLPKYGYLTPAMGLGSRLIERLNLAKVITFETVQE